MKFLIVDDERLALETLDEKLSNVYKDAQHYAYLNAKDALMEVEERGLSPDVAFLDIEMPEVSGLEMAKRIREKSSNTKIVFVTGYDEYAISAVNDYSARGYILKPVSEEKLKKIIENNIIEKQNNNGLKVRTFGNFDVTYNNEKVIFQSRKAKELFALLVDRHGGELSTAEIAEILYEGRTYDRQLKNNVGRIIRQLISSLREINEERCINKSWNSISINTQNISCDYYDFLHKDIEAINSYKGAYMEEYSWAEFTNGMLGESIE